MAATLEPTHKGNINDKTITERDRELRDFNVTLLASAIARSRHYQSHSVTLKCADRDLYQSRLGLTTLVFIP